MTEQNSLKLLRIKIEHGGGGINVKSGLVIITMITNNLVK